MRFRVERNEFTDAVSWTARTLPQRPTGQLQVLSGLMLATTEAGVRLSAFDYEVAAEGTVPAAIAENGSALVPGRLLAEITRALPAAPIDVEADANRLVLTCGSTRFTLPLLPVEDYPDLPGMPHEVGRIEGAAFAAAVSQVVVAAGRDETLPVLTGVRIEIIGDRLVLAATDRYRLAVREMPWRPRDTAASGAALIPSRTLNETAKALGAAGVEVVIALGGGSGGESLAGFAGGARRTTTRLVEGQFPDYRRLLPPSCPLEAFIDGVTLAEAVKRVRLVAAGTSPVRMRLSEGEVVLEAGSQQEAQAREALPIDYRGPDLTVAFNHGYLLDGLSAVESDMVRVGFASADDPAESARKPVILQGKSGEDAESDYRYLLMPVRLPE
jgi:DNA polymerase-3 subunit beta